MILKKNTAKKSYDLKDVDVEKVFISNKTCSGEKSYKYFIGYLYDDYKVKPLYIILPKTSAHIKSYEGQTKWMYFLIEYDNLLEKYNAIWDKVSTDVKNDFTANLSTNTKVKFYGDGVADFRDKKIPTVDSNHTCLAVVSLDSALKGLCNR